jgi:hypothetical protein
MPLLEVLYWDIMSIAKLGVQVLNIQDGIAARGGALEEPENSETRSGKGSVGNQVCVPIVHSFLYLRFFIYRVMPVALRLAVF